MGKHSSNNHDPFGLNDALDLDLAPNNEHSVMEMKTRNQGLEPSNHDVQEGNLETKFDSNGAFHNSMTSDHQQQQQQQQQQAQQLFSASTEDMTGSAEGRGGSAATHTQGRINSYNNPFSSDDAVDSSVITDATTNNKELRHQLESNGNDFGSVNKLLTTQEERQQTKNTNRRRTLFPSRPFRTVREGHGFSQGRSQQQQHYQPNSLSTIQFGLNDPLDPALAPNDKHPVMEMTDFGQLPESFHANSYVDSPLQETGSRTPNSEHDSLPVTESSQHQQQQQQPQHHQANSSNNHGQYGSNDAVDISMIEDHHQHQQHQQLFSASFEGVNRSDEGNGVSRSPRGAKQNVTSDALLLHEALEVDAVNSHNSGLGSMHITSSNSSDADVDLSLQETRFGTSNSEETSSSTDTISDTTSHTTISRAASYEDGINRQQSYDISLANDSNDQRISVTKSSLAKRIGDNFNKKDNIRFQITKENQDLLELNSQDKSKYYAEFAGLELNGIKFKAEDKLFMANFRNVKFVNCDFSEILPENFKTIKFYNCEFDEQTIGPNNSDLSQKNQAAQNSGYTTNKKVDYKGLKSDIKSEADNIKKLANHRRLDKMDVKEIVELLQKTKTRGEAEEREAKKPDSISAGIKSSLKRLSGRNQFQPSTHVKYPHSEQLITPRIRQQS